MVRPIFGVRSIAANGIFVAATIGLSACVEEPAFQRGPQTPASYRSSPDPNEQGQPATAETEAAGVTEGTAPVEPTDASGGSQPLANAPTTTIPADYDPQVDASPAALTDFRSELAPYGTWEDDSTYGTVWTPSHAVVGSDFAPYVTAGHWALDDTSAWLWVSDYDWGWAPFHYGRWVWISGRGWSWIPGRVYAPAWVVWRSGYYDDHYLGWAPMPPTWYWRGGVAVTLGVVPPAPYVFCSSAYVFRPSVHVHILPATRVSIIAPHTRPYVPMMPATGGYYGARVPRGPAFGAVHVPAAAIPATRVAPPPRAVAYARTAPVPVMRSPMGARPGLAPTMPPARVPAMPMAPAMRAPGYVPPPYTVAPRLPSYPSRVPAVPSMPAPMPRYAPMAPQPHYAPMPMPRAAPMPMVRPSPMPMGRPSGGGRMGSPFHR